MPLSYSQIQLYRRCPRQYEYAVIKKITRPISPAEGFGASVHNALKKWGEIEGQGLRQGQGDIDQLKLFVEEFPQKEPKQPLTLETLLGIWHQCVIIDSFPTRMEADMARVRGAKIMEQFHAWWGREPRTVVGIEKSFKTVIDDIEIAGRFDRIEAHGEGVRVIDYKTGFPRSQEEVDADLQLSLYAIAAQEIFQKPCAELVLLFLDEDGVTERVTQRSPSQLEDAIKQLRMIKERIALEDYRPTPAAAICKRCPYRHICDVAAV